MKTEPYVEVNANPKDNIDDTPNSPPTKKSKFTKIIVGIIILFIMMALGKYFSYQRGFPPQEIQFSDISMEIPGNMKQVTGENFNDIFTGMGTDDADSKMAYLSNPSWVEETGKFIYGIMYSGFEDLTVDEILSLLEAEGGTLPNTSNYYIGEIDARITENALTGEMEGYTEHAATFAKNNSLYMISYISSEDNHEENFYKIIDTIE